MFLLIAVSFLVWICVMSWIPRILKAESDSSVRTFTLPPPSNGGQGRSVTIGIINENDTIVQPWLERSPIECWFDDPHEIFAYVLANYGVVTVTVTGDVSISRSMLFRMFLSVVAKVFFF